MNNSVKIDYLSYTFTFERIRQLKGFAVPEYDDNLLNHPFISNLVNLLGFKETEITEFDFGRNRFKNKVVLGDDITILFNGPHDKDGNCYNMIEMTGSGCRTFSERGGSWSKLLTLLTFSGDFSYTRIDIATDLIDNPNITMKWLINKVDKKEFVSKFKRNKYITSDSSMSSAYSEKSQTIYFGSKSSNRNLVIYDKLRERRHSGEEVLCNHWIRFESRFYKDSANDIVCELLRGRLDDFTNFHSELLNSMIEFKKPGIDKSRKKLWDISPYWNKFIGEVPKFKFNSHHSKRILKMSSKEVWFKKTASKSLLMLLGVGDANETGSILVGLVVRKIMSLTPVELVAVNEARQSQGKQPYKDIDEFRKHLYNVKNSLYKANNNVIVNGDDDDDEFPF